MDPKITERLGQLRRRQVWQIRVDNEFWLIFAAQPDDPPGSKDLVLVIGGEFSVTTGDGDQHHLDDDHRPSDLGPAMKLLWQTVADVALDAAGELSVEFVNGSALLVPPHPAYESWRLQGPGWRTLVCPPGGGTPTWPTSESGFDA